MSRKSKIDSAEKLKIVECILADVISVAEAARLVGVHRSKFLPLISILVFSGKKECWPFCDQILRTDLCLSSV